MAYTDAQIAEYNAYLLFLRTPEGQGYPVPSSMVDYFTHLDEWSGGTSPETPDTEWSASQNAAYERYKMYSALYREPNDFYARTIQNFFDNYDVAGEQLNEWESDASAEYQQYRDYVGYRWQGEWYAGSLDDFVTNYTHAQKQIDKWITAYGTAQTEQAEQDAYYDVQRARSDEAAREAYRPEVQYGPAFYQKQEALGGESVYYQDWMRNMFPELQRRFQATQPAPVGYPTRAEARTAAGQTAEKWGQYLGVQAPELREEFYSQKPWDRGERPQYYQPPVRQVSYY